MISVMLKRNSRCKLTSDDVLFLQRPNAPPNAVVQFTVHVNAIQYLPAVAYYLRQNMIYASGGHWRFFQLMGNFTYLQKRVCGVKSTQTREVASLCFRI